MRILDRYEINWLKIHGDRKIADVHWSEKGEPYVLMGDGKGGVIRIYIND